MSRPLRPCLSCGTLTRRHRGRCDGCQSRIDRIRNQRREEYKGTWRATSRRAVAEQPWCSLCGRTKEQLAAIGEVLTLDHEHAQVECRPCNSGHARRRTT